MPESPAAAPSLTALERRYLAALNQDDHAEADRLAALVDASVTVQRARLHDAGALAAAALWYAEQGIAVFPLHSPAGDRCSCGHDCASPAKHPRTGAGFKDATIDPGQVRSWWERWPQANIGAPTGITFDVVDVDGLQGIKSLLALTEGDGLSVPGQQIIGRSLTPRGGGHHLFVPPTGRGNYAGIYPGVDFRGLGGYVVVPPSRGINGRLYTWSSPLELGPAT